MKARILLLLALVFALVVCAGARAVIVPQRSIAGAKLGVTRAKLEASLGKPIKARYHKTSPIGLSWWELVYNRVTVSLYVLESGEKVVSLATKSKLERTDSGVGVGSTLAQLRAGLRGETCRKEFGIHHCWVGKWEPGKVVSDFRLVNGRVSLVTIGSVLD